MTDLTKKVSRRVALLLDNRLQARNRDNITVTLYPDGTIGFRGYKRRREYRLPLSVAYAMAIKAEAKEELREKQRQDRLAGKKIRKPRRSLFLL